ncbi:hypothetical protein [Ferruginibacter sp. HRS2-29]|uniref:hypothetical protein n=1 Tax=Ferruginibacter sp. HRS2-29 TaxID=2487334 RepID=UPI0020CBCB4A|nr:hypothetical protein [Ferruginibacter sp. HRS2-29]MCP9751608.1 hypothetical protein [Ferruginibacter sp. HRS2-29]
MNQKNLLLLLCLLIVSPLAFGQTWDGSTSSDWNLADNWTPATIPTASSSVSIPNTPNKPILANSVTIANFTTAAGSGLNFNGFSLTATGNFNLNGATLANSTAATDISINLGNAGSAYVTNSIINDHIIFNLGGSGGFYEAYGTANIFNGNATFNLSGTGDFYTGYSGPSTHNGSVTINRTTAGDTRIFNNGATAISGNFAYTNNAGGNTYIGQSVDAGSVVPIGGSINITADGSGNPLFYMRKLKNLTGGGSVTVSGRFTSKNPGEEQKTPEVLFQAPGVSQANAPGLKAKTPEVFRTYYNGFFIRSNMAMSAAIRVAAALLFISGADSIKKMCLSNISYIFFLPDYNCDRRNSNDPHGTAFQDQAM